MAAEVSLKEESALEIGEQLAVSFKGLQNVGADTANGLELEEEKQQTSFLESISGGIKKMVVFFGGIAAATKEANRDRLITEAQGTEAEKEALADDPDRSLNIGDMFKGLGEKTKAFAGGITGIFGGLFGKAALFGLLLAFATNMDKFSGQIKEVVGPIFEGLKSAFKSIKEDIFPIITNIFGFMGEAFTAIQNILKGLFEGDGSAFLSGIKTILVDLPIRFIGIIGDAFFSLTDAVLKFFGIESQFVQDAKMFFRQLPETISNAIKAFVDFFVVDIPNKFNELKTAATDKFTSLVTSVKDAVVGFVDNVISAITETIQTVKDTIMAPIKAIKDKVSGVIGGVKDFFSGSDEKAQVEKMTKGDMSLEEAKAKQKRTYFSIHQNKDPNAEYSSSDKASMQMANHMVIDADPTRDESHKAMNSMKPMLYADYDIRGDRDGLNFAASSALNDRNEMKTLMGNDLPQSNTPVIEPNEFMNNGGQLNKDSQEFASMPPSVNMNVIKGGDNSTVQSNQTYTNIAENTTTSDMNAKKIFKTA